MGRSWHVPNKLRGNCPYDPLSVPGFSSLCGPCPLRAAALSLFLSLLYPQLLEEYLGHSKYLINICLMKARNVCTNPYLYCSMRRASMLLIVFPLREMLLIRYQISGPISVICCPLFTKILKLLYLLGQLFLQRGRSREQVLINKTSHQERCISLGESKESSIHSFIFCSELPTIGCDCEDIMPIVGAAILLS